MVLIALLLALAPPIPLSPVEPPPPPERLAAAYGLIRDLPVAVRSVAEIAVIDKARAGLVHLKLDPADQRLRQANEALKQRLVARIPADLGPVEEQADLCRAEKIAREFSVEEIRDIRAFLSTPGGRKFARVRGILSLEQVSDCYGGALTMVTVEDADYRAIGVPPPPRWSLRK